MRYMVPLLRPPIVSNFLTVTQSIKKLLYALNVKINDTFYMSKKVKDDTSLKCHLLSLYVVANNDVL